jgi:hypothetical protein
MDNFHVPSTELQAGEPELPPRRRPRRPTRPGQGQPQSRERQLKFLSQSQLIPLQPACSFPPYAPLQDSSPPLSSSSDERISSASSTPRVLRVTDFQLPSARQPPYPAPEPTGRVHGRAAPEALTAPLKVGIRPRRSHLLCPDARGWEGGSLLTLPRNPLRPLFTLSLSPA